MGKERYRNNLQKSEKIRKKSHRNRTKKGGTDTIYILVLDKNGPVTKLEMDHYKNEHKQKLASVHSELLQSLFEKSRQEFVSAEKIIHIDDIQGEIDTFIIQSSNKHTSGGGFSTEEVKNSIGASLTFVNNLITNPGSIVNTINNTVVGVAHYAKDNKTIYNIAKVKPILDIITNENELKFFPVLNSFIYPYKDLLVSCFGDTRWIVQITFVIYPAFYKWCLKNPTDSNIDGIQAEGEHIVIQLAFFKFLSIFESISIQHKHKFLLLLCFVILCKFAFSSDNINTNPKSFLSFILTTRLTTSRCKTQGLVDNSEMDLQKYIGKESSTNMGILLQTISGIIYLCTYIGKQDVDFKLDNTLFECIIVEYATEVCLTVKHTLIYKKLIKKVLKSKVLILENIGPVNNYAHILLH
jgi:hypothetical protein